MFYFASNYVDKGKTGKEEARELLLKDEAATREKVREIQRNLSLILTALGEIAIANPIFAHSQLPSLVCVLQPYHFCTSDFRVLYFLTVTPILWIF